MKKTVCDFCGNEVDYSDVLYQRNSFKHFIQTYDENGEKVELDICKPCMIFLGSKFESLKLKENDNE